MLRNTVSLLLLLMLKQAAIQEIDAFAENHQQPCGEGKKR
jgi:hypothetical protein